MEGDKQTSEQMHGIPAQPGPTCPMIDAAIDKLRNAELEIRGYGRCDEAKDLTDIIERVERWLFHWDTVERDLQDIRRNVEAIRVWGEEWKQLCLATIEQSKESQ